MKHGDVSRCVRTVKLQQEMLHAQLPRAQPQIDLTSCSISIVKQAHYMMNSILSCSCPFPTYHTCYAASCLSGGVVCSRACVPLRFVCVSYTVKVNPNLYF